MFWTSILTGLTACKSIQAYIVFYKCGQVLQPPPLCHDDDLPGHHHHQYHHHHHQERVELQSVAVEIDWTAGRHTEMQNLSFAMRNDETFF